MLWGLLAEMRQHGLSIKHSMYVDDEYKALQVCVQALLLTAEVTLLTLTPYLRQVLLASHPQGQLQAEL